MEDRPPRPAKRQLNVRIPAELARRARHQAIDAGTSISDVVEAALHDYLHAASAPQAPTPGTE